MTSRPKILDQIMFYILERAKCEEDTEKYLQHVLNYCKKDYQQAFEKKNQIKFYSLLFALLKIEERMRSGWNGSHHKLMDKRARAARREDSL